MLHIQTMISGSITEEYVPFKSNAQFWCSKAKPKPPFSLSHHIPPCSMEALFSRQQQKGRIICLPMFPNLYIKSLPQTHTSLCLISLQIDLPNIYFIMHLIARCKEFRHLLSTECVMVPGCFNGLIARLAAQHGFRALYVSGGALTASSGVPDIGLRTLSEFSAVIKDVSTFSDLPVIADADTGFGQGEMCARTVHEYFHSGASGLHIEDQVFPKRCGHLNGKELIPTLQMVDKIKIARQASQKVSDGQFIVCARTDAKGVYGLEECITRSKAYIDAGADMIFPEGLDTAEEFKVVAKALKDHKKEIYLLANMTEFGKTPYIDISTFKDYGYNCVIYPVSTLRVAMKAVDLFFSDLKANGSQKNFVSNMQSRKELYDLLRYTPGKEWRYPENEKK